MNDNSRRLPRDPERDCGRKDKTMDRAEDIAMSAVAFADENEGEKDVVTHFLKTMLTKEESKYCFFDYIMKPIEEITKQDIVVHLVYRYLLTKHCSWIGIHYGMAVYQNELEALAKMSEVRLKNMLSRVFKNGYWLVVELI